MLVNVALVQHRVGDSIGLDLKLHLFRKQPDIICFPEYWGAGSKTTMAGDLAAHLLTLEREMERLSRELSCTVVGGTSVMAKDGRFYNSAPLFQRGQLLGRYQKLHPTQHERQRGIVPGEGPGIWSLHGIRLGVAICADCLHPEIFDHYRRGEVDLLFVPNASPLRAGESVAEKYRRDQEIFVAGAARSGSYVVKVCGTGTLFGGPLQGRSLVAAPWGVLHRVPPDQEDRPQVICATLSLEELHDFRVRLAKAPSLT